MNATCRSSPSRYTNLPSSLPGHPRPSITGAHPVLRARTTSLGSGQWESQTGNWFWFKLHDSLRLNLQLPEGGWLQIRSLANGVLRLARIGIAPPVYLMPESCTPNPAPPPPHACGRGGTTQGSSASQPPVVFRPYPPWVVGAGSGRVLAPNPKFAAGTAAGAAGGFLGHREGQKSVGFCPLGGAHLKARGRYTLYIMLGHTPRSRCPAGA
jgi:hypothetical protein